MKKYELYRLERDKGFTAAQIARKYGVSRQAVASAIGRHDPYAYQIVTEEQCVYPIWRNWMNAHKISRAELCRRMGNSSSSDNIRHLSSYMRGNCYPTKGVIDKLIKATGLKYEELFWKE